MIAQDLILNKYQFSSYKTYIWSLVFIAVNIILPSIFHAFGITGQIFLPIYFLVLLSSLILGWRVGLITAIFSPLFSFLLMTMPALPILPFVIFKGVVLAILVCLVLEKTKINKFLGLVLVLLLYQLAGFSVIYFFTLNLKIALMDIKIGYPGLLLQLFVIVLFSIKFYAGQKMGRGNKQD
ncbi:MAG: hypothetical protein PHT51_04685 [Patescibacteria group bacterium]|nr:hypothetical protein [Patescibacteria group bacterium]MDD4610879.1 hypothetical protein [Patescibacteria group bacterium]